MQMQRVLKWTGIESEDVLLHRLSIIPEFDRKVLETRWGLYDGVYCHKFKTLGEKLGISNPSEAYDEALNKLSEAELVEHIVDREEIKDWRLCARLAQLIPGVVSISGVKLLKVINEIPANKSSRMLMNFYLNSENKLVSRDIIATNIGVSSFRVMQLWSKWQQQLRKPDYLYQYRIYTREEIEKLDKRARIYLNEIAKNDVEIMEDEKNFDAEFYRIPYSEELTAMQNFLMFTRANNIAESEEILLHRLSIIPEFDRKVLETRWGLYDGLYCHQLESLGQKLGISNPREVYLEALQKLREAELVECIVDREELNDWALCVRLGNILKWGEVSFLQGISGVKLLEVIDDLSRSWSERKVVFTGRGLRKLNRNMIMVCYLNSKYRTLSFKRIAFESGESLEYVIREFSYLVEHLEECDSYYRIDILEEKKRGEKETNLRDVRELYCVECKILLGEKITTVEMMMDNPDKVIYAFNSCSPLYFWDSDKYKYINVILEFLKKYGFAEDRGKKLYEALTLYRTKFE